MDNSITSLMWGFGLTPQETQAIRLGAGVSFSLVNHPEHELPLADLAVSGSPFLVWIPFRVWSALDQTARQAILDTSCMQKVVILDRTPTSSELESLLEQGIMSVLTHPLRPESITRVVDKASELQLLFSDIYSMAREVSLERELLGRKNAQLTFINRFITRATESLDPSVILSGARQDLDMLLPVNMIQGAFWNENDTNLETELFLTSQEDPRAEQVWTEFMLESVAKLAKAPVEGFRITHINGSDTVRDSQLPAPGQVMLLPLEGGRKTFGCLALHSLTRYNLGRDQVEILQTGVKHLSLALKNALQYREVKTRADFDGLTRIYNRSYFDVRLKEEIRRHHRYRQKMSLLMADLDHFKQVNDLHGHPCGDMVLKEVGSIIQQTIRITDFAARYGGEEFAIILPQADEEQSLILAERLRLAMREVEFLNGKTPFAVSMSIGIATMDPAQVLTSSALIQRADQALYAAKNNGRDQVVSFGSIGNSERAVS